MEKRGSRRRFVEGENDTESRSRKREGIKKKGLKKKEREEEEMSEKG
jgi:hypothetical protein